MIKRWLIVSLLICGLLSCGPAWGAYAFIDSVAIGNLTEAQETSAAIDTTGADLLVCVQGGYHTNFLPPTDSKSNTWASLTFNSAASADASIQIHYATNVIVGAGHTFTTGAYQATLICMAFSGAHTTSPADQERADAYEPYANNLRDLATGTITPIEDNELIIAGWSATELAGASGSVDGGFTITDQIDYDFTTGLHGGLFAVYLIQTTATAANPTGSWVNQMSTGAVIASFKVASVGGGAPTAQYRRRN